MRCYFLASVLEGMWRTVCLASDAFHRCHATTVSLATVHEAEAYPEPAVSSQNTTTGRTCIHGHKCAYKDLSYGEEVATNIFIMTGWCR